MIFYLNAQTGIYYSKNTAGPVSD